MRNQERARELEREKEEVTEMIEFYKQQESKEKQNARNKIQKYGNDLLQQMEYQDKNRNIVRHTFFNLSLKFKNNIFFSKIKGETAIRFGISTLC
jgi:hypothetical protein